MEAFNQPFYNSEMKVIADGLFDKVFFIPDKRKLEPQNFHSLMLDFKTRNT